MYQGFTAFLDFEIGRVGGGRDARYQELQNQQKHQK